MQAYGEKPKKRTAPTLIRGIWKARDGNPLQDAEVAGEMIETGILKTREVQNDGSNANIRWLSVTEKHQGGAKTSGAAPYITSN